MSGWVGDSFVYIIVFVWFLLGTIIYRSVGWVVWWGFCWGSWIFGCECISGMVSGFFKAYRFRVLVSRVVKLLVFVVLELLSRSVELGVYLYITCWFRGVIYFVRVVRRLIYFGVGECFFKEGR